MGVECVPSLSRWTSALALSEAHVSEPLLLLFCQCLAQPCTRAAGRSPSPAPPTAAVAVAAALLPSVNLSVLVKCKPLNHVLQTWGELDCFYRLVNRCWAQAAADRPNFQEIIAELRLVMLCAGSAVLCGAVRVCCVSVSASVQACADMCCVHDVPLGYCAALWSHPSFPRLLLSHLLLSNRAPLLWCAAETCWSAH